MIEAQSWTIPDEAAMRLLGAQMASEFKQGDVIYLHGNLGAGKTTFARGLLAGLGWMGEVRSPTFNLLQDYPTHPPVLHADLYRVASWEGIGVEDYLDSHLCLIEWPERMEGLLTDEEVFHLRIEFDAEDPSARQVTLTPPQYC